MCPAKCLAPPPKSAILGSLECRCSQWVAAQRSEPSSDRWHSFSSAGRGSISAARRWVTLIAFPLRRLRYKIAYRIASDFRFYRLNSPS
jgi:hypothetical protein